MEHNYSDALKKLTKKQPPVILQITIILLALLLAVTGLISYKKDKESLSQSTDSLDEFISYVKTGGYTKLTPMFLSEPFASNYDSTIMSCLAIDENYNTYIVSIKDDDFKNYRDLIDYTYDETILDVPAQVTFEGTSQLIEDDLKELAIEGYKIFWGVDSAQRADLTFLNGNYYLDTTQERTINYGNLALFIIGIIVLITIYINILNKSKIKNERNYSEPLIILSADY